MTPGGDYLCMAEGFPIPPVFPAVWITDVDASDEELGIRCKRMTTRDEITTLYKAARLFFKVARYFPPL